MDAATITEVKIKPSLTPTQRASLKTLPENWRDIALASPNNATSVRAIAAAFSKLIDSGAEEIAPLGRDGKPNVCATVADVKYGAGYHSRERVEFIIATSPATVRDMFSGADVRGVQKIHDGLKVKTEKGTHEEPANVNRVQVTATVFQLKYEFVKMLSPSDMEKVVKYAAARLHPDNKVTGNEEEFKRFLGLWEKIKNIEA